MKEPIDLPFENFRNYLNEEVTFNLGHAYEFVLAAAMVARFTDRFDDGTPQPLTRDAVEDVMLKYFGGYRAWEVEEGDGLGVIEFDGTGLPPEVLSALSNPSVRRTKEVQTLVTTAIEAVNKNGTLKKLSDDVITNGKPDVVDVVCGGTSGQMKTKSDVDVFVNGRENRKAGFSVKYGGVKQVGQFAGSDAVKNMQLGFKSFGMDVNSMLGDLKKAVANIVGVYQSRTDPIIAKDKQIIFSAVSPVFTKISKKYGGNWLNKENNIKALTNGLLVAARGREEDLEIIKSGFSFDKKTFEALSRGLLETSKTGDVEWKVMPTGNPTIGLYANNMLVFSIRFRYDADKKREGYTVRFRLLVELGRDIVSFIDQYRG